MSWWEYLLISVAGYLATGGVITASCTALGPNRWVDNWSRPSSRCAAIDPVAVRWLFWSWPLAIVWATVLLIGGVIITLGTAPDKIMRLTAPRHASIYGQDR